MLATISSFILHPLSLFPLANPTQEEVFKSIKDTVSEPTDYSKMLPILAAGAGLVVLAVAVTQWRKREVRPRGLNHRGKLLKEMLKTLPLKSAELKQLKLLLDDVPVDQPLGSVLTMLLCPSVLARAIQFRQRRNGRFDRKAINSVARKVGVTRAMLEKRRALGEK